MSFYRSIAEYYDLIFPLGKAQVDFVKGSIHGPYRNKSILDVGCGTGDLALALSRAGFTVTGIDSDLEMLNRAEAKAASGGPVTFTRMDMREISARLSPSSFDAVLCLGNTLVHLDGLPEIEAFCAEARTILRDGGCLLLQILNYDHILDHNSATSLS